jgi:hypothetical protein
MKPNYSDLPSIDLNKNRRETLRLEVQEFRGRWLISARVWFAPHEGGDLRPGPGGWCLALGRLPDLTAAIITLERQARAAGLLPPLSGIACEVCGVAFEATRADTRFCSPKCRAKASRTKAHGRDVKTNAGGSDSHDV